MGDLATFATQLDAVPGPATERVTVPPGYSAAPARWPAWLIPAGPALVTLAVTMWRISGPSFWRDEGATLSAVHRSFPQLIRMLGQMDAVHGLYYVLMWPLVRLADSGEVALRLPSALAMAAAAGLLTALGRRLVSPAAAQAGTISGSNAPLHVVRSRLSRAGRVWVAEADAPLPGRPLVLRGEPFQLIHRWQVSDIWLWLYHREQRPGPD